MKTKFPIYTVLFVLVIIALTLLTSGCTTYNTEGGPSKLSWINLNPNKWVVNNTPYVLRVTQDGVVIAKELQPGAQVPVAPRLLADRTIVVVTATEKDYQHEVVLGSDTYTFRGPSPEVWLVNRVMPAWPSL